MRRSLGLWTILGIVTLCGWAKPAFSQGASVALIDRGDFACFTSQQSSNLVWGGIKYLEGGELGEEEVAGA